MPSISKAQIRDRYDCLSSDIDGDHNYSDEDPDYIPSDLDSYISGRASINESESDQSEHERDATYLPEQEDVWSNVKSTTNWIIIEHPVDCQIKVDDNPDLTPSDIFYLLVTEEILEKVVMEINIYAQQE